MKKIIALLLVVMVCISSNVKAQHTIVTKVFNHENDEVLQGVLIKIAKTNIRTVTNENGVGVLKNVPKGNFKIEFSYTGFESASVQVTVPQAKNDTLIVALHNHEEELEEVFVQSTRTSRTIKNSPTRVETISGEELDEKNNMRPANVSMLIHESTGMQLQQTSATTGNASIRVQGLDGRYTQLLKDGYPNFGNFANGLSVLEIPPLDLKQVEIIKGPASTLYGGGAIAGVVNFISKTPKEKLEGNFILNQSNIGQSNIAGYLQQKKGKFGFTVLAAYNYSKAYDVDKDDFSEIPKSNNYTIHPRLFFYPDSKTTITIGNNLTQSNSKGGDMQVIKGNSSLGHVYFEKNTTTRNTVTLEADRKINSDSRFYLKQSFSTFNRNLQTNNHEFAGLSTNSYTDLSYTFNKNNHTIISGLNIIYDDFKQHKVTNAFLNSKSFTTGFYAQDTWDVSEIIKIEGGLRVDNVTYKNVNFSKNQTFVLPRVSVLLNYSNHLSSRIGAGLGYKVPTIFTEETEAMHYNNLQALDNSVTSERSVGGTIDVNYKNKIGADFQYSFNIMYFLTSINKPLILEQNMQNLFVFKNETKPVISNGIEANIKFIYKNDLKLFVGYTLLDAKAIYKTVNNFIALTPKNKLNFVLMYEKHNNFKLGFEGYYSDKQYLSNGTKTPNFIELGFLAEKTWKKLTVFINFENFTDERQSNYKRVVNAPNTNPTFDEIWNHTEGRVINGGIKIKL
ncbi:MAG TPA: TonB-dependent receptor plug domain-containing protein [Chitinophagaceae bacterium]|nr:TonB-dependent receptor [Chitinophagaceae bacterium]HMZ46445.1 TonB-dependent receptor plug domain-containing protein [Chitinophagaceae bacterium]HNF29776.1 TonB-dependent receptor plug domain-containing protein [Chitinophagaceae bacterium]HNM34393.1 TonB-dependent receptor plug domain-containing protein [Chitinophagaceae bacterium]